MPPLPPLGEPGTLPPIPEDGGEFGDGMGFWDPQSFPEFGASLEELLKLLESLQDALK
jgi:hypothetical protein